MFFSDEEDGTDVEGHSAEGEGEGGAKEAGFSGDEFQDGAIEGVKLAIAAVVPGFGPVEGSQSDLVEIDGECGVVWMILFHCFDRILLC